MSPLARLTFGMIAALALTACQEDETAAASTDTGPAPTLISDVQAKCERDGGSWGTRGDALFVCYKPTSDANRYCTASSDCENVCLARSRTCAPTDPFLGCHEVLTDGGQRATQCVN